MSAPRIKLVITAPEFFKTPLQKLAVEENRGTGRVYFLNKAGRIVAVGQPMEDRP